MIAMHVLYEHCRWWLTPSSSPIGGFRVKAERGRYHKGLPIKAMSKVAACKSLVVRWL